MFIVDIENANAELQLLSQELIEEQVTIQHEEMEQAMYNAWFMGMVEACE